MKLHFLILSQLVIFILACNPANKCVERVRPECSCMLEHDPVCGCNNKTYSNACMAECASIMEYSKGECPPKGAVKLEGMVWQLTTINKSAVQEEVPEDITISIKFEQGKLSGIGGCNQLGANYKTKRKSLSISEIFTTKKYCENSMQWEQKFLDYLGIYASYKIIGESLTLNCGEKGSLVFRLNWKKRKGE